ncbi:MAG: pantoate--beta-alanine ligase [Cyclonatronaceae bacterium]
MIVAEHISDIRQFTYRARLDKARVGLVPTMGALHEGHLRLIGQMKQHAGRVVVSIFVNPTQFGPGEDFEAYPRQLQQDLDKCRDAGADAVFCPKREHIYAGKHFIRLELEHLGNRLCGAKRPGHFHGVIQVVNKLFNIVGPDVAIFGQKDIQQYRILEQMTFEFNHAVELVMGTTVRAADGLALSSRNAYLSPEERALAPALYGSLKKLRYELLSGMDSSNTSDKTAEQLLRETEKELNASGFRTDYIELVDYKELQPATLPLESGCRYVLAAAAYLGKARLIDNILLEA